MGERRAGLEVYLDDPDVSIDTNHLERALRVIPMGRKNWLFSWTELGARHVGIVQSLLVPNIHRSRPVCGSSAITRLNGVEKIKRLSITMGEASKAVPLNGSGQPER